MRMIMLMKFMLYLLSEFDKFDKNTISKYFIFTSKGLYSSIY